VKIQADGLRIGDVIENTYGQPVTVQKITRASGGCLDINQGGEGEMNGHAWEWVKVISRGPEPTEEPEQEAAVPETCACPPGAAGEEEPPEPCGADDCEVAFRVEVGWPR
jgi:hypothetical protein